MPDGIAVYKWRGQTLTVMANEGDFREDNVDRSAASAFGGVNPLDRLRVSNRDSSVGISTPPARDPSRSATRTAT